MASLTQLEEAYAEFSQDLGHHLPDGLVHVDLSLLHRLDLLTFNDEGLAPSPSITHYFHVVESPEKITLFNERYAVWIIPEMVGQTPTTYCLIGLNGDDCVQLELGFHATGIYNTSRTVLRVLEQFLEEIQENEEELTKIS